MGCLLLAAAEVVGTAWHGCNWCRDHTFTLPPTPPHGDRLLSCFGEYASLSQCDFTYTAPNAPLSYDLSPSPMLGPNLIDLYALACNGAWWGEGRAPCR